MPSLGFIHRFEPATDPSALPLLVLHGTGGDEDDLLPLARMISPKSALLSPRGKVLEHGMARFFRRLGPGVLDEDDVRLRAGELADFVGDARKAYGIAAPVAVGYSNGANVATAILLLRPDVLAGAVLVRAMLPLKHPPAVDLAGKSVLILSGDHDEMINAKGAARLASTLQDCGANVTRHILPVGHEWSQADVTLSRTWLETHSAITASK
jgi:phospholipase/carboxylesterase